MTSEPLRKSHIARLRALSDAPRDQFELALQMLSRPKDVLDVLAALKVLRDLAEPAARAPLLQLYAYYVEDPTKRDRGATVRREILAALRFIALSADADLLEAAAVELEWLPPGPSEVGGPLRASALLALDAVDEARATSHAVRLLYDPHVERMSGEPALTAARVLGAQGQTAPLYGYVIGAADRLPEVVAECLRHLVELPTILLECLVDRIFDRGDPAEIVGLSELLTERPDGERFAAGVDQFLAQTRDIDLYRYVVTVSLASRRQAFIAMVIDRAKLETREDRIVVLLEALTMREGDPDVEAVVKHLNLRLKPRRT